MSIISWILVGAIAGWLANKFSKPRLQRNGCFFNIILGITGAFVGGIVISAIGGHGVTGFNLWSILVATLGAVLLIWIVRALK